MQNYYQPRRNDYPTRVNWQIKAPSVRVVQDGIQLGIMPSEQARRIAQEAGLDLVEVSPTAHPPVCHIMDYGKYKFDQKIKEKESARRQRESQIQLKEIRLRPGIAEGDIETKVGQAKKFLAEGKKVQFNLQFKGYRELSHKDQGFEIVNKIVEGLAGVGDVEKAPKLEGNRLVCRIMPKV